MSNVECRNSDIRHSTFDIAHAAVRSIVFSAPAGTAPRRPAPFDLPADGGRDRGGAGAALLRECPGGLVGDPCRLPPGNGRDFLPHAGSAADLEDQRPGGLGRTAAAVDRHRDRPARPILLLVLAGGLALHKRAEECRSRNSSFVIRHAALLAGLVLSLLALKPQLSAGLVLWMLLRRDGRTLTGLATGFAVQFAAVAALLGPGVWHDYFHALPAISAMTRRAHFSPMVEASFVGIASNLASATGDPQAGASAWESAAMKLAYAATVSFALVMLCRVVWSRRPLSKQGAGSREQGGPASSSLAAPCSLPYSANYEYACGAMFITVVPPYLIVYDQSLLAVALVMLWSSPKWRWGVLLFAAMTAVAADLSLAIGFSATGLVVLATMFAVARTQSPSPASANRPCGWCGDIRNPVFGRDPQADHRCAMVPARHPV